MRVGLERLSPPVRLRRAIWVVLSAAIVMPLVLGAPAMAQDDQQLSVHDLAKLVQNPLADSVSIPFAYDNNFPLGPYRQAGNVLNLADCQNASRLVHPLRRRASICWIDRWRDEGLSASTTQT